MKRGLNTAGTKSASELVLFSDREAIAGVRYRRLGTVTIENRCPGLFENGPRRRTRLNDVRKNRRRMTPKAFRAVALTLLRKCFRDLWAPLAGKALQGFMSGPWKRWT